MEKEKLINLISKSRLNYGVNFVETKQLTEIQVDVMSGIITSKQSENQGRRHVFLQAQLPIYFIFSFTYSRDNTNSNITVQT